MGRLMLISLFFLVNVLDVRGNNHSLGPGFEKCGTKSCVNKPCGKELMCTKKDKLGAAVCCPAKSFCPTGLYTGTNEAAEIYLVSRSDCAEGFYLASTGFCCPKPFSYYTYKIEKTLPDKFDLSKPDSTGKKCKSRADCGEGSYCGPVYNPRFSKGLDKSLKDKPSLFCFKNKVVGMQFKSNEPSFCTLTKDCNNDELCYNVGNPWMTLNETKEAGVCVKNKICSKGEFLNGVQTVGKTMCKKQTECLGAGGTDEKISKYSCEKSTANTGDTDRNKLCCVEKVAPLCKDGRQTGQTCSKDKDCTLGEGDRWCDTKVSVCCYDNERTRTLCPDKYTPIGQEPKCINNGEKCPKKNGICRNGFCCPPVTTEKRTDGLVYVQAKYSYTTELNCTSESQVNLQHPFTYCHPTLNKIVVIGTHNKNGDTVKTNLEACQTNTDCKKAYVCVSVNDKGLCYVNEAALAKTSKFGKTMLFASLGSSVAFSFLALITYVCYRSRTICDKAKAKKGKKGKGKGNKKKKKDESADETNESSKK